MTVLCGGRGSPGSHELCPRASPSPTCTRRWLSGCRSSSPPPTRLHTLTPPRPQVNACRVQLLTAVASTGSPCFSVRIFSALRGMAAFWDCQGRASGLFHVSSKSSGSQHLGRGGLRVTSLPVSLFARRGPSTKPEQLHSSEVGFSLRLGFPTTLTSPRGSPFEDSPSPRTKHHRLPPRTLCSVLANSYSSVKTLTIMPVPSRKAFSSPGAPPASSHMLGMVWISLNTLFL